MAMLRTAVIAVLAAAVLLTPTVNAQRTEAQQRDDSSSSYSSYQPKEEPHQSYSSYQPQEAPHPSYAPAPPPQQYMIYPAAPLPSYEPEEEEPAAAAAAAPKEDKKCAVKLVLPPLIIITIFIGLILLHLVVPALMPALVNPFVLPFVALVNALTGASGGGGLAALIGNPGALSGALAALLRAFGIGPDGLVVSIPPGLNVGQGRQNLQVQGAFESLLHLTAVVTAAIDDEKCLARLLCQAGTTLPKESSWSKSLRYLLPKEYQPYITLMEKARSGGPKGCARDYSCPQLEGFWQEANHQAPSRSSQHKLVNNQSLSSN